VVRVPTSVLLAVLAAAGLLALAPALVRRYDATERLAAERALSTARVIDRRRRPRTVPGRRPVNPPRLLMALSSPVAPVAAAPVSATPVSATPVSATPVSATPVSAAPVSGAGRVGRSGRPLRVRRAPGPRPYTKRQTPAIYRRRRVLAALVLLNASELCGVWLLGPGFWIGSAPSLVLLAGYLVHLRNRALSDRRRQRAAARRAAWLAARQAELRREQERRQAARREALRRAAAARAAAQRESVRLSQRYVRGRAYEARAAGY
jgi:hypothetical protein